MKRDTANRLLTIMVALVLLLAGCADDKAPVSVEKGEKADRLFDTQRSALDQAKETADAAGLRNQQFQGRAKELD